MLKLENMPLGFLSKYTNHLCDTLERILPRRNDKNEPCMFFMLFTDDTMQAQYCSNISREGAINLLRETADRLEKKMFLPTGE